MSWYNLHVSTYLGLVGGWLFSPTCVCARVDMVDGDARGTRDGGRGRGRSFAHTLRRGLFLVSCVPTVGKRKGLGNTKI